MSDIYEVQTFVRKGGGEINVINGEYYAVINVPTAYGQVADMATKSMVPLLFLDRQRLPLEDASSLEEAYEKLDEILSGLEEQSKQAKSNIVVANENDVPQLKLTKD